MGCVCASQEKEKAFQKKSSHTNLTEKNSEDLKKKDLSNNSYPEKVNSEDKKISDAKKTTVSSFNECSEENFMSLKSDVSPEGFKSISKMSNESTFNSTPKINSLIKHSSFAKGQCIFKSELGDIYSGLCLDTGEIIAIKSIGLNSKDNEIKSQKLKFLDKILSLKHKNLINIMTYQESDSPGKIDLILEFCNGGSIKELLKKFGVFDEKLIKIYIKQILEGLAFLHDNNIIHKNLVSSNILVDGNGIIKINDYLNNNINYENTEAIIKLQTKNFTVLPFWISPELAEMNKEVDFSTDIWSVGSLIIEMATNNYPWKNVSKFKSSKELIFYIANSKNPPKIPSHLSKSCKDLLILCFQRNPKHRPSAKKLLEHEFFKGIFTNNEDKVIVKSPLHTENHPFKFSNNSIKDNLKSTYLLKNHVLLKDDDLYLHELRNSMERSVERVSKLEKHSHVSSIKEENEKIVNFLSDNPENNACFSVSVTVYSAWSIEDKKINLRESQLKQLKENILEEMNEALESSPVMKDIFSDSGEEREKKNHFTFENINRII